MEKFQRIKYESNVKMGGGQHKHNKDSRGALIVLETTTQNYE